MRVQHGVCERPDGIHHKRANCDVCTPTQTVSPRVVQEQECVRGSTTTKHRSGAGTAGWTATRVPARGVLGTKRPSMTSTCTQSAPASTTDCTCTQAPRGCSPDRRTHMKRNKISQAYPWHKRCDSLSGQHAAQGRSRAGARCPWVCPAGRCCLPARRAWRSWLRGLTGTRCAQMTGAPVSTF